MSTHVIRAKMTEPVRPALTRAVEYLVTLWRFFFGAHAASEADRAHGEPPCYYCDE